MTRTLLALGFMLWGLSALYAWRDWYKSLCGLIVFAAILQHPDMPREILGVPGLNLWNGLFLVVLFAWMLQRGPERLRWDMPRAPGVLLWLGLGVVVIASVRLLSDSESMVKELTELTFSALVSEYLVNPVKWVVVGLLLFDGCRDRRRLVLGLASIFSFYVVISLQVLRAVLPGPSDGRPQAQFAMMEISTSVGLHRNDVSVMLAGAFWALMALRPMVMSARYRVAIILGSLVVMLAQAITGGRAGYLAWCAVGLTLGLIRWRRYLLLAPLLIVVLAASVPSVVDRALFGLSGEVDLDEVSSGRTLIWPLVIDKIWDAPFLGYGRAAMQRTGVSDALREMELFGFPIGHPHNAYLEMLLDSGLVGLVVTLALYGVFLTAAVSLFRDRRSPERMAVGGIGLSVVLALLVGAFTGQSFWPREATFGVWCSMGILLRMWVLRSSTAFSALTVEPDDRSVRSAESRPWAIASGPGVLDTAWWRRGGSRQGGAPVPIPDVPNRGGRPRSEGQRG